MTQSPPPDFFTKDLAQTYDQKNANLAAIAENMHFLIRLLLKNLPAQSHILCIGVGTGAEILSLAQAFPQWTFVGVDPSASMLEVCQDRLKKAGIENRCQLIHGYVQDAPTGENFDAVLSILVGHFVKREERLSFLTNMTSRLKKGGYLINTEISFDLHSPEFSSMLENWKTVQSLMGATPESLANLPQVLKEILTVLAPQDVEAKLRQSGITLPVRFFQAFMISGWYGQK